MRWEDERYVRLYTRDTVDWEMMPWQARALFPLLLRKVDRAGILHLGKHGARGLANVVGLPVEVTEPGLEGLIADGSVELHGDSLVVRNFIEAQEATSSDAKRAREYRERHRSSVTNSDGDVTKSDATVTPHHGASRAVTERHGASLRTVPSRTVPSCAEEERESPSALALASGVPRFDLEALYEPYPRKEGRAAGMKKLKTAVMTDADYESFRRATQTYAVHLKANPDRPAMLFSTWCNERWRDWIDGAPDGANRRNGAANKTNFRPPMQHVAETKDETDDL